MTGNNKKKLDINVDLTLDSGAFGNVYVFNLYVEEVMAFGVNNVPMSAGSIAAPATTTKPLYVPQQLVVTRTNLFKSQLTSPMFVQGNNPFMVEYNGQNWQGTANLSTALSFNYWLYLCYQTAWLFDTIGGMQQIYADQSSKMVNGKEVVTIGYTPPT